MLGRIARHRAGLAFGAFATLCGVAVHLFAELFSLGWTGDAALVLSSRHAGLGLLALAALATLVAAACSARRAGPTAPGALLSRLKPSADVRFVALALGVQLFVFASTEIGEGAPLGAGDVGLGLVAALLASAAGAYLVARFHARVLEVLAVTFVFCSPALTHDRSDSWQRLDAHVRVWRTRAITFSASLRPPPALPAP